MKALSKIFGTCIFCLTFVLCVRGQQASFSHECGTSLLLKRNLLQDPEMPGRLAQAGAARPANPVSQVSSPPPSAYIIPVVFHVIVDQNNPTPIPSYAQIQMQLATLNAAFSNSLNSLDNTTNGPHASNAMIQFCLAKKMWVNNAQAAWPTSSVGVMYYTVTNTLTSNVDITNNTSLSGLSALTSAQFPAGKYLNIWCVPNISTSGNTNVNAPPSVIGMATFPWMSMPLDGIIMRNDCIGNNTYNNFPGAMIPAIDKGNILVHEAGHYLGLFHSFETITNSNISTAGGMPGCYGLNNPGTEGDLISDTPPTALNGPAGNPGLNTCNESYGPYGPSFPSDVPDQEENFMSYSDDDKMNTFTQGQSQRMWGALDNTYATTFLTGQRASLVTSTNLTNTGVNLSPGCGPGLLNSGFRTVLSNITCTSAAVQFYQPLLPNYLSATTYTWYFGDGSSSNSPNPLHNYNISPYNFAATLVVSDGATTSTSTLQVNIPNGLPQIVDWSGKNNPVCRGSEQSIVIRFPPALYSTNITDGATSYMVPTPAMINGGVYDVVYTFTIASSGTWSLALGSCNTSTTVAGFTVTDCCSNLVYNGDFEAGPVGFTSQYALTSNNFSGGSAAIALPFGMYSTPPLDQHGKEFMVDVAGTYGCHDPNINTLLLGQTITGLQPSSRYYLSFKAYVAVDSFYYQCTDKYRFRFHSSTTPNLLSKTIQPHTFPPPTTVVSGGSGLGWMEVFSFMVTTPANITASTVFSLELFEIENRQGMGFDHAFDNFILAQMGMLELSPVSTTINSCTGGTVQMSAVSSCSNISSYTLIWQPTVGLSCTGCPNPVANVAATTVYTLVAIPPITTPPSPNIVLTSTVLVNGSAPASISVATLSPCFPPTYSLSVPGAVSATWQPIGTVAAGISVTPTVPGSYTVDALMPGSQGCPSHGVIQLTVPVTPTITAVAQRTAICLGESVKLTVQGTPSYSWSTSQTSSTIMVSPQQTATYTVVGYNASGCPSTTHTVAVKVLSCVGIEEREAGQHVFSVYPNPNTGQFSISASSALDLVLYDMLGQVVRNLRLDASNNYKEEIRGLSNGVYFISGKHKGTFLNEKVIVTK